jgi:hypothetical protein
MNGTVDYANRADAIRGVLAMRASIPRLEPTVFAAQLRLLDRIETGLAASLARDGIAPEVAAQSAFLFVRGCADAIRAERAAVG